MGDFFLEQKVVVSSYPIVHVRLETQLHMIVLDWQVLRRLHIFDNVVKYLDLVDAYLDAILQHLGALVSFLVPRVRHHLLETVTKLRIWHQDVIDQTLDFVTQVASELVSGIQNLLVQALCVRVFEG